MRRIPYLLLVATLLLVGLTLQSCGRDESPQEEQKEQDPYTVTEWENDDINGNATMAPRMQFSVSCGGQSTRGASGTNGKDYAFALSDLVTIKVAGKDPKVYKVTNITTGKLEYNGTPSTDGFYWENKDNINVTAWSRGNTDSEDASTTDPNGQSFTLETDQATNGYRELLYMAETPKSYGSDGSISLSLEHMLSRVVITVNQDAATPQTITGITIGDGVNTLPTSATFTPANSKKWTVIGTQKGTVTPKTESTNSVYSAVLIPTTYDAGMKFINIAIGLETFAYELPANVELLAGKQYNYTITVKNRQVTFGVTVTDWNNDPRTADFTESEIKKNPLWWVAEYNVATIKGVNSATSTTFTTKQSIYAEGSTSTYAMMFNFADALKTAAGGTGKVDGYHQPTFDEQISIVPMNNTSTSSDGTNIFTISNTDATSPYEFSEQSCNVGGNTVAASTSYMYKATTNEVYAVRFVGTRYASAWHFKYANQTIGSETVKGLLIESYLVNAAGETQAKAVLQTLASSTVWEAGRYNASSTKANLRPTDTSSKTNSYCQRFLPACGYCTSGTGASNGDIDANGNYWSATAKNESVGWRWHFEGSNLYEGSYTRLRGYSLRLFLDH